MAPRPRPYKVLLTRIAERDLEEIHDYIAESSSALRAGQMLQRLKREVMALALEPERGNWPRELLDLGLRDFRQVAVRPYRIFYRVIGQQVLVLLVADGRRDLKALLERRLLGA